MTPLLVGKGLGIAERLQPTDIDVPAGQLVALIGPNGSGKTSLLRALAGVEPGAGEVVIAGERLTETPPARRPHLLGFLPAAREVVWPIKVHDLIALASSTIGRERINDLIDRLDLAGFADRPINSLSTGERARVLLGRALAPEPHLLLLDEPLSNLDVYWSLRTLKILRDEIGAARSSALVAVHDLGQVEAFDRVLVLDKGKVVADMPARGALESRIVAATFGVERVGSRWEISSPADPRSLP